MVFVRFCVWRLDSVVWMLRGGCYELTSVVVCVVRSPYTTKRLCQLNSDSHIQDKTVLTPHAEFITTVTIATDRTPILHWSPVTIHERASATRSLQHQSNPRTNNKTSILQISNATHVTRSGLLIRHPEPPPSTPTTTEPKGDNPRPGYHISTHAHRRTFSHAVYVSYIIYRPDDEISTSATLTYSMVQSLSWEANWFAASQEITRISRNPKVHYRTHKRPTRVSILGQPNPVRTPTSHLLEIHPNISHPFTRRSP